MGRNTYQTCKAIMKELLQNPEIRIEKQVLWKDLKIAIEKNGGEHFLTLRKYKDALHRYGFIERINDNTFKIIWSEKNGV